MCDKVKKKTAAVTFIDSVLCMWDQTKLPNINKYNWLF